MNSILKMFSVCIVLIQCLNLKSQSGLNCANAVSVNSYSTCNYLNYSTTGNAMWFKFVAQSKDVNISINTSKFGIDIAHIHNVTLYSGTCSGLNFITDDELPFEFNAKELNIDMNASGLIVGTTYYLKLNRKALHDDCDKLNCKAASSTSIAYFSMCIENIDVLVPPDFGIEKPNTNHFYEQNRGQLVDTDGNPVPQIKMYTKSSSPAVYIGDNFTSFVFSRIDTIVSTLDTIHRVDMTLVGANTNTRVFKTEQLSNVSNYFLPHVPNGITNNKSFYRSVVNEIYPKIDLQHYSNSDGLKFYFVVRPGGDANLIKLKFDGATSTATTSTGGLKIETSLGNIVFEKPHVYRLNAANNVVPMPTSGNFIKTGTNEYQIDVQNYPPNMPVIIQIDKGHSAPVPHTAATNQNMNYSTYFGGSGGEAFYAVKVNQATNRRYIAGTTNSNTFPAANNIFTYKGSNDAVILGYTGTDSLIFATYYGGNGYDVAKNIAIQSNGNIYITGRTQSTDNIIKTTNKPTASQQTANGNYAPAPASSLEDAFILELNYKGDNHVWSRYLGGVYWDEIGDITVDVNDNLYIVGHTNSGNFPISNAYKNILGGSTYTKNYDWFIMKFNSQSQIQWSTFYGGDNIPTGSVNIERAYCVDVDNSNGNVYVGGMIGNSSDFPKFNLTGNTSATAFYNATVTGNGAALVRFNSSGVPKLSTQLASVSSLNDLKILPDSSVLMIGYTTASSSTFSHKTKVGAYNQKYFNADAKGVILQMNNNIDSLWSTFYNHAPYNFEFKRLAVTDNGAFCIGGTTNTDSLIFPASSPIGMYSQSSRIWYEGFISYFDANGSLYHAHFLGGNGSDYIEDIDFYKHQDLYAVGSTNGIFPIASTPQNVNLIDPTYNGGGDGFITRFEMSPFIISVKELSNQNDLSIKLYPNPITDYFLINTNDIKNDKNFTISVYDILGKEVFNQNYPVNSDDILKINCNQWSNGLYLINIKTNNNKFSGKIIKQ